MFYIKEWEDKSASLITMDGHRLWTFSNIEAAITACRETYNMSEDKVIRSTEHSVEQSAYFA